MLLLLIAIVDRIEFQTVIIGEELNGRSLSDGLMNNLQRYWSNCMLFKWPVAKQWEQTFVKGTEYIKAQTVQYI